ncbi:YbbR-like domain-containing protein [Capnocytophaga sp.]|uniref:YbbR-like domain-containing protein n=1 Tax=Capnocytophaga sp. TaxID=44737 RepID=UPI0026DB84F8|nr:YbbR-like domain-containing protein [Capnocytophaga sp.]MDO5105057.1 YbbR-like domain-containing protein [Capnocytophaga sp.]
MPLTRRKIRLFLANTKRVTLLVCVLLSFFLWILIRLSKNLQREFLVDVTITNIPEQLFLNPLQKHQIHILAEGKGYSMLKYYAENQFISVDFADLEHIEGKKYKLSKNISDKLKAPHAPDLKIHNTYSDTIVIDFEKKYTKKVPVIVDLNADYQREYQLTELLIQPDSVLISGNKQGVETFDVVFVSLPEQKNVKNSFTQVYKLQHTASVRYHTDKITIQAMVEKVSEQLVSVPVRVLNVPKGSQVKVFPGEVSVLCSGDLDILKNITADDIVVEADYDDIQKNTFLPLTIRTKIKRVKFSFFKENKVEVLIRKSEW